MTKTIQTDYYKATHEDTPEVCGLVINPLIYSPSVMSDIAETLSGSNGRVWEDEGHLCDQWTELPNLSWEDAEE